MTSLLLLCLCYLKPYREAFKGDYEALQARLSTLPDQLTHDVMVGVWCDSNEKCGCCIDLDQYMPRVCMSGGGGGGRREGEGGEEGKG